MKFLYNILMTVSEAFLRSFGNFFGKKAHQFAQGQKDIFDKLKYCNLGKKKNIWIHVSSLGEYEQVLPLIEKLKINYSNHSIVLSFFSPSGYEIKKDSSPADCIIYLPIDTRKNAKKLLDILQPEMVFFVKYDFWPNYLFELKKRNIRTYLISGLFTNKHKFFKPWNKWLRNSLKAFHHFFVQDKNSRKILLEHGFKNISITGDTRFDRVAEIARNEKKPEFVKTFKQNKVLIIAGSTWQQDEKILTDFINQNTFPIKFILAPHHIEPNKITALQNHIQKRCVRYSEMKELESADVLILDNIGLLNKAYAFADIAYVGGGFGKSIHNIQEPAVYGIPIITGPNIQKFKEARDLFDLRTLKVINDSDELAEELNILLTNASLRKQLGAITQSYVEKNLGATQKIIDIIS